MFYYPELSRRVKAVGLDGPVHDAVVSVAVALDMFDLTDQQKAVVFDVISTTGRRKLAALPERLIEGEWEDFNYGNVKIGDYVRIKPDAYDSPEGSKHNGLVGILTRAAAYRYFVEYLGESYGNSQYHPMSSLQSLRWV
jgi:hypothetical protein